MKQTLFAQQTVDLFDEPAVLVAPDMTTLVTNTAYHSHAGLRGEDDSSGVPFLLLLENQPDLQSALTGKWNTAKQESFGLWEEWGHPLPLPQDHKVFIKYRGIQLPEKQQALLVLLEPRDDWGEQEEYAGDHSSVVFFESDLNGKMIRGFTQLSLMTGFDEEHIRTLNIQDLFSPRDRKFVVDNWTGIREGWRINGREMYLVNADGETSPFWIWLYLKHGAIPRVRGVAININTQKSLAIALEAAEERFNVLYRESSDPVFLMTLQGEILSANQSFETATGLNSSELFMGDKGWGDFIEQEDIESIRACLNECVEKDQQDVVEFRMKSREGGSVWYELGLTVLHNEHGDARGVVAVARDIDRRKQLEDRLREQASTLEEKHRRAQSLIGNLKHFFTKINELPPDIDPYIDGVCGLLFETYKPDAVFVVTKSDGESESATYKVGHDLPEEVRALRGPDISVLNRQVMETGLPMYMNNLHQDAEYQQDALVTELSLKTYLGAPLRDSKGMVRGILCLVDTHMRAFESLDVELLTIAALHIAARLRTEEHDEARRELEEHIQRSSKMEAVGMLAGGIAHDFNNILSGILGFSSYLLSKTEKGSAIHRDIGLIEQSATKASELTRQLLAFTRQKHFEKTPVDLNQLIKDVLSIIGRTLSKDVTVETQFDDSSPSVLGDPGQLNQVIMNLSLNAFDAMAASGGELVIQTEQRQLTSEEMKALPKLADQELVVLSMTDSGRGMDKETVDQVFDPFFTTKSERGGSGLGLSIVYGIVTNHGGDITVRSQEGDGTTFTIYLPACDDKVEQTTRPPTVDFTGEEVVMVVDDELILRQMVTEVLKGNGYKVLTFSSGQEAVDQYPDLKDRVDVILLDMVMPGMNGYDTFMAIRKIDADVPILLTSGFSQVAQATELIESGAKGLLNKPYRSEELLQRIRDIVDEED